MKSLDDELKQAFRREEPPDGFAERLLARVAAEEAAKVVPIRRGAVWSRRVAAAAAAAIIVLGLTWLASTMRRAPAPPQDGTKIVTPFVPLGGSPEVAHDDPQPAPEPLVLPPHDPQIVPVHAVRRPKPRRAVTPSAEEVERAKEQVLVALKITKEKLGAAERRVLEIRDQRDRTGR